MKTKLCRTFVAALRQSAANIPANQCGDLPRRRYGALLALALLSTINWPVSSLLAQGTAFTYQGRLNDGGNPANGLYDVTFALFAASSGGSPLNGTITNSGLAVSNGLFTVLLDFGGQFNGNDRWLEAGVRTNGGGLFTTLTPRQKLTPAPYAITAENVDGPVLSSQLSGALPPGLLSGTYGDAVTLNNAGNNFSGNGAGLGNVNAATLDGFAAGNFWQTTGNAGTTAGVNFLGTTDNQPLELKGTFVGVNRNYQITANEFFGVHAPVTNNYGGMYVETAGAGLPFYGYAEQGSAIAYTYLDSSSGNSWKLYLNGNRLTVTTTGNVGLGTVFPATPLDLLGQNNWDLSGTEGDFRIGNPTYRLKMGVALAGTGAGDSFIRPFGGTSRLLLGSLSNNVLTVVSNFVGINTITPGFPLDVLSVGTGSTNGGIRSVSGGASAAEIPPGLYAGAGEFAGPNGVIGVGDSNYFSSYGVFGTTAALSGSGVYGSSGNTNGSGVFATGASAGSAALTVGVGAFAVENAGTNSPTTAFIQVANTNNTSLNDTTITNPVCDGDPNAMLIVTHNYNPPGVPGNTETHPFSVYYDGVHWHIYHDDGADILGMSFNVLIIKSKAGPIE